MVHPNEWKHVNRWDQKKEKLKKKGQENMEKKEKS